MTKLLQSAPLFPLNALVCPGGRLPLRVFEQRYLEMVSTSMRSGSGFVVVMLKPKSQRDAEQGGHPFYRTGTLVNIVDFGHSEHALRVTAEGRVRVHIESAQRRADGLWIGQLEVADEEAFVPIPERYEDLANVLKALVQHPMVEALNLAIDFDDCRQVGWRLTELLPLENAQKQHLLEMTDPLYRLQRISDQLIRMMS
jgi:Lon protease-like protein